MKGRRGERWGESSEINSAPTGEWLFGGGKKNCGGSPRGHFFFLRANLSGRTSAAGWAALLLPSTATKSSATAAGSLLQPQAKRSRRGHASGLTPPELARSGAQEICANSLLELIFFFSTQLPFGLHCAVPQRDSALFTRTRFAPIFGATEATRQCKCPTCLFLASPRHP